MSRKSKMEKDLRKLVITIITILILVALQYVYSKINNNQVQSSSQTQNEESYSLENIPEYQGNVYAVINDNKPNFTESDYTTESFEKYSDLDSLGRCHVAYANICKEIMPKEGEKRGDISSVTPTGFKGNQNKYNGEYIYNRSHLIGYQLAGENANELNLITGTRYFNVEGMLPFENQVDDYIEAHENNHVLYRVTPIYQGNNKVANGVQMEAFSVEDRGEGVCFNVYVYNVQPGVVINYETGENWAEK